MTCPGTHSEIQVEVAGTRHPESSPGPSAYVGCTSIPPLPSSSPSGGAPGSLGPELFLQLRLPSIFSRISLEASTFAPSSFRFALKKPTCRKTTPRTTSQQSPNFYSSFKSQLKGRPLERLSWTSPASVRLLCYRLQSMFASIRS